MNTSEYSDKYNIPVSGLCNLRELSIDLVFNATFGQQFKKLQNLQKLRFDYCHVDILYNDTFLDMPVHIKEFHMTTCKHFVVIEVGVLVPFPHLKVLNLTNSNIHLTQALRSLHPFQNKSMDAILFRGITHGNIKHDLDAVVLTLEMMKYISTICITTLDFSDNQIVSVKHNSIVSFEHPDCFEHIMISSNSFSLETWAVNLFLFLRRMTNIKVFDFSYFPLRWRINFFFFRNIRRFAEKGLELNFDYDVYVSYSDDCISFVKELQKKVEDEWGFKICFEDRDFIAGESIATERATAIHRCRHVMFLVSPSIVENEWTRFEIERAKYEKFSKNLQKIVVITRDISLDNIPVEFSSIWKDVL
ncbi:unnamed protein product [Mytilus edulis]|uniref:TIR domain-containing protein n=1 Tax=Mytilus edulis TaxID=6550 RepID=A0A8S3PWU9_MYTED|nr:unnamed protein product [Mytilus edulis]